MYRTMVTARLVDEAAFRLNRQGKAPFVVPVSGHEGCQVGTAWPLRPGQDIWVPYYRDVAVVLIAGMTPYEIFLGLFAKAEDPSSGGRQMPSHWGSRRLGIISHSSPIATQVPHAAGIAYAAKYRGEDAVVGCWFGEGATSAGAWHEGLNFAGIHKLPVIFVCENNLYGEYSRIEKTTPIADIAARGAGYAIPSEIVDGQDVDAVMAAMSRATKRAREGGGPTLLEMKTYRYAGHSRGDPAKYRPEGELDKWKERDPIALYEKALIAKGVADAAKLAAVRDEVMRGVAVAVAGAKASPMPEGHTIFEHVSTRGV
jgi:2-oxoisovalerate dehydrogenase E1 component alpha subunit